MAYGNLKVDTLIYTSGGSDTTITVSSVVVGNYPSLSITGTISGAVITGDTGRFDTFTGQTITVPGTISGTTITGDTTKVSTLTGISGTFTTRISGAVITGDTAGFTTITGTTVTGASGNFGTIELGNASDTTLSRSSAGVLAVEGVVIPTISSTNTLTNKTLTDPAIVGTILEDIYTITDGAAFEIDPSNGSVQLITLGAARTPKGTNFAAGESVLLMVDDGSAYALTWTDTTFGTSGVLWSTDAGSAPTLNTSGYTSMVLWKVSGQVYGARVGDA